jgi:phosphohistidine phosphatase
MKRLIFVRHARAEDQTSGITDFERSLTVKGKVTARQMAKRFRQKEPDPGLMITSPALRALETAYIFAAELGIKYEEIRIESCIYFKSGLKIIYDILKSVSDDTDTITLFGHNPSFTEIPDRLSKTGCEFLTKTSIVCISFPVKTWSELKTDSGKQDYFLKPEK